MSIPGVVTLGVAGHTKAPRKGKNYHIHCYLGNGTDAGEIMTTIPTIVTLGVGRHTKVSRKGKSYHIHCYLGNYIVIH